jgi:hypothetical protein
MPQWGNLAVLGLGPDHRALPWGAQVGLCGLVRLSGGANRPNSAPKRPRQPPSSYVAIVYHGTRPHTPLWTPITAIAQRHASEMS